MDGASQISKEKGFLAHSLFLSDCVDGQVKLRCVEAGTKGRAGIVLESKCTSAAAGQCQIVSQICYTAGPLDNIYPLA